MEEPMRKMLTGFALAAAATLSVPAAAQNAAPTPVALEAPDGITLKATYYPAGAPGPGILLLHQCNRDRSAWASFARAAAGRGFHVLTLDYRGFGESEGQRLDEPAEQQAIVREKWPGDVDAAFAWLQAQPGVDKDRIGAAGASCGVNQSVQLARRHAEVKTVALLSGGVTAEGREYLRKTPSLSVLASASQDDGDAVDTMRWILGWSRNPDNSFIEYKAAGHGTDMFAVEKGLEPKLLAWFDARLRNAPKTTAAAPADTKPGAVEEFWALLRNPDGAARAKQMFEETRRTQPSLVLFPESEVNLYGYELLQAGNAAHALWVFRLNVDAYPKSANTYDSLSDAYLALGKREEALRYAEKALKMLETDTKVGPELRQAIQDSAQKKVKELRTGSASD
jgi:dienelactone hydrolase